ncbi:MAG: glycosyltransferase family 39 protein, partial [Endomicrobiia bacterium]
MNVKLKDIFVIIFVIIVVISFFIRGNKIITYISATYDEPLHLMQGYSYIKTGSMHIIRSYDQPVLAKIIAGLGLLFLKPQPAVFTSHKFYLEKQRYSFANLMLYYNNHDAEVLINAGRRSIIFFSSLFVIIFFVIVKNTVGIISAIFAIIFYSVNTSIIAHSCLTTQDMFACIFYFLSIYSFYKFLEKNRIKDLIICSIFSALLMVTKYSYVVLFTNYLVVLLFFLYFKKVSLKTIFKFLLFQLVTIISVGLIVYNKNFIELFIGLYDVVAITSKYGRSNYFFGKHSTSGFILYFPFLFLLKTEIPLLILFFVSLIKFFKEFIDKNSSIQDIIIISSILIYLGIASFSKMQIGHRHILVVYPLIILQVSKLINIKKLRLFCLLMLLWNVYISIKVFPWYISYFNEIIGGAKNGWKYFTDSNIDWGQGLKQLGLWVRKNNFAQKGIYLSYFGVGDPEYYNIKYKPIGFISNLTNNERLGENIVKNNYERVIIGVSVTNLQATYYQDKTIFNFLKKLRPLVEIADSIFIYDISEEKFALN